MMEKSILQRRFFLIKYFLVFVFILTIFIFPGCNEQPSNTTLLPAVPTLTDVNIPGETLCSPELQKTAANAIMLFESVSGKSCNEPKITNSKITQQPASDSGVWIEQWTVDRCGANIAYLLTFTPDAQNGGTSMSIEPVKLQ